MSVSKGPRNTRRGSRIQDNASQDRTVSVAGRDRLQSSPGACAIGGRAVPEGKQKQVAGRRQAGGVRGVEQYTGNCVVGGMEGGVMREPTRRAGMRAPAWRVFSGTSTSTHRGSVQVEGEQSAAVREGAKGVGDTKATCGRLRACGSFDSWAQRRGASAGRRLAEARRADSGHCCTSARQAVGQQAQRWLRGCEAARLRRDDSDTRRT
ncbi:hypothetical protein BDV95DRAFT_180109 [Massariosphaeria phaeospora]|uniref:Uncharacterized protein n=1 Tax=Massariosphaeria phaeospora TaxID=100035 RepID=A0A7C8I7X4_9PLEO|nr:hypothetical protein BDV95DRAFT_180109 [Massariosphaeria phaeospora]